VSEATSAPRDDDESAEKVASGPPARTDTAYRGDVPRKPREPKIPPTLWQRATYRWTAITAVMAALLVIYTQHPYYLGQQFAPWRPLYTGAFVVWLAVGLFYVRATLEKFKGTRYAMRDGGLHLLILGRALTQRRLWRTIKNRRLKTTVLGIAVKSFFTPLMTGFLSGHSNSIADAWMRHKHLPPLKFTMPKGPAWEQAAAWWTQLKVRLPDFVPSGGDFTGLLSPSTWTRADMNWGLGFAYDIVFFVDCGWALMGYASESRWLGNKTRSVEPTAFGWLVCLACYPPYNNVLGTYLPLENGVHRITSENILLALRFATVLLFAIYATATVAFGFKFSNLTNRGITSRGPYRFVRHPAYLCKCTAWWLEHLPTITLQKAFFLTLLCGVYALRAWTEERHLSRDPDYRAYKRKVPWILIPGVY
jgi:protein-S-isoprenylcysteine O-methyltransferase Ste14